MLPTQTLPPRGLLWLYLLSLFLLPWSWFPPLGWLHEHAQWGDLVFALCAAWWLIWRAPSLVASLKPAPPPDTTLSVERRLRWFVLGLLGYALSALFSFLWVAPEGRHLGALVGVAELCALGLITADLSRWEEVRSRMVQVLTATALLSALSALLGLAFFYAGVDTRLVGPYGGLLASTNYARVEGGLYHPNLFANWCVFAFVIASRELSQRLRRVVIGLLFVSSFFAFSRAFLCLWVALSWSLAKTQRGRLLAAVFTLVVGLFLFVLSRWDFVFDPTRFWEVSLMDGSRWETWTHSFGTFLQHPIFGIGVGGTPGFYGCPHDAHFTPLQIAATMGVVGALSFLLVCGVSLSGAKRAGDYALFGGLLAVLLDGLTQDINDFRHLWVLFGLAVVVMPAAKDERPTNEEPTA